MRTSRQIGGSTWNSIQYFSGTDVKRTIRHSKSITFSAKMFLRSATWFTNIDSDGLANPFGDMFTRAKKIAKMYTLPIYFEPKYEARYRYETNWGAMMNKYRTFTPKLTYYEEDKRFIASMPLIEISSSNKHYNFIDEFVAIKASCKCSCLACSEIKGNSLDTKGIIFSAQEDSTLGVFGGRFEYLCDTHAKQALKAIGALFEPTDGVYELSDADLIKFISFIAVKRTYGENRKKRKF